MRIVWSNKAKYTFYATRDYLIEYRNSQSAQKFAEEALHILELISKNPHLGKFNNELQCNQILVWKYISLYYIINKDFINLIWFYDTRQKPLTILTL